MDAKDLVAWALEVSLYLEPRRPGLTTAELTELGGRFGVTPLSLETQLRGRPTEAGRIIPFGIDPSFFATYEGDLRNIAAFDYVLSAFKAVAEAAGQRPPIVDREAIVASATAAGLPRVDVELAIATYRAFEAVPESESRWELRRIKPTAALPSAQREGPAGRRVTRRERYVELVEGVRELVERRSGGPRPNVGAPTTSTSAASPPAPTSAAKTQQPAGRPAPAPEADDGDDPLDAFRAQLPGLGQGRLVAYCAQLTRDFRLAEEHGASLAQCILAATLVELALTTACPKPTNLKPDPKGRPPRWGLIEMAKAASGIGIDEKLRGKIERLYRARQRLQVAKVLELTGNISDVSTSDAVDASEAVDATLRAVLAWHERSRART